MTYYRAIIHISGVRLLPNITTSKITRLAESDVNESLYKPIFGLYCTVCVRAVQTCFQFALIKRAGLRFWLNHEFSRFVDDSSTLRFSIDQIEEVSLIDYVQFRLSRAAGGCSFYRTDELSERKNGHSLDATDERAGSCKDISGD